MQSDSNSTFSGAVAVLGLRGYATRAMNRVAFLWSTVLMLVAGGCGSPGYVGLPAGLDAIPGVGDPGGPELREGRAHYERGSLDEALDAANRVLAEAPDHVDAHRLRQDVMRRRGRVGLLFAEAEARLQHDPQSAIGHYLMGRLVAGSSRKLASFRRATSLAPRTFWGWLGTAFALRSLDLEQALRIYQRLYELSDRHQLAAVALASALRGAGRTEEAARIYAALRAEPASRGIGELGLAETWFERDERSRAWAPLLKALELRPFDPGVRALLQRVAANGLSRDRQQQILDVLRRDPKRLSEFCSDGGAPVLASLFAQAGEPFAARAVLETYGDGEPGAAAVRRLWRELLLRTGEVREFLVDLNEAFPRELLDDETNKVRGVWIELLRGSWMRARDPIGSVELASGLTEALLRAGLIEEAEVVGTIASLRHAAADADALAPLLAVRDEARREQVFERAVRRVVYQGYLSNGERLGLSQTLAELRRISTEYFGRDVVGTPRVFSIPVVGSLVDPFAPGLGRHLARYNRHLVLGERSGGPVEAMLLTRLSVRDLQSGGPLPLAGACQEVIGEDREIRPLSGVLGGDLAGVALLNHYIIDMDAVREWAAGLHQRRATARDDDYALLRDPLPEHVGDLEPAGVDWRLSSLSPVQDTELLPAVLDMIRWHERAHLADSFHYLPVEANLWRVAGLLLRNGFRPSLVEAELEARAETASLALSPHTRLVLAHIAVFLSADGRGSPHARGFRSLARKFIAACRERGLATPQASRWHLLDPEQARSIGAELMQRLW